MTDRERAELLRAAAGAVMVAYGEGQHGELHEASADRDALVAWADEIDPPESVIEPVIEESEAEWGER